MAGAPTPNVAQLVAEHHQAVYGYAYRLTGTPHDAEDLSQQTFLAAQRKLGNVRNPSAARSWLFAILRNCFLKERQRRRPALASDLELRLDWISADSAPDGIGDQARLQEALSSLPDGFRLAVVMFYFEQCSYREISEQLGVPLGTVMSRLARAKDHLRKVLSEPTEGVPAPKGRRGGRARTKQ